MQIFAVIFGPLNPFLLLTSNAGACYEDHLVHIVGFT